MKKMLAFVLAAAMALSLAACGGNTNGGTSGTGADTNAVTVQLGPNPETLDPALNSTLDGGNMIITAFEGLLITDENQNVIPGQAESYEVSEDGLTWTFTMRDGLKWSDGTDLTAKDFEYSMKRLVDPNTAAPYAETVVGMIAGYEEALGNPDAEGNATTDPNPDALQVTASEDGKTLTIVLSYPCAFFDKIVAFTPMVPVQQATVEANGEAWATDAATYVSNGPFYMTEWVVGQKIVMKKNPNYVGGWDSSRIKADSITFLLMEDDSATLTAFQSGQADLVKSYPTEELETLQTLPEFKSSPYASITYQSMNLTDPLFQDVNVRKALSLAIDREYLTQNVLKGLYRPAYTISCPGVTDQDGSLFLENTDSSAIPTDYEVAKAEAQKALADAGYPNGEGFPSFTFITNDSGYNKTIAEYMQQCYRDVLGIDMQIEIQEWSAFSASRRAGSYQMARNGWVLDYNDPSNVLELFYSTNGNNDGKYANPEFDAAIDASRTADASVHYEKLHEAEEMILNDYAAIPLAFGDTRWLQSEELKGVWFSPYGYFYLQYATLGEVAETEGETADSTAAESVAAESAAAESTVAESEAAESTSAA